MPTTPKLSPEVEKEFDEKLEKLQRSVFPVADRKHNPIEIVKDIKSFLAKVIAEEVEKVRREQIEVAIKALPILIKDKIIETDNGTSGSRDIPSNNGIASTYSEITGFNKGIVATRIILNSLKNRLTTPDQLSE